MIKTYFINGFMDAGKTTFIKNMFSQEFFQTGEKTLIILCEDGDEEFDEKYCNDNNIHLVQIDYKDNFEPTYILEIEKKIKPTRVIVEFNGMWERNSIQFPWYWDAPIEITLFDASTFEMYSRNMKTMLAEQVRNAAIVLFNRCDNMIDKLPVFRRTVKALNIAASVAFEDKNGEMNPRLEEDLPFDVSKDEIVIGDDAYALFYLDAMEDVNRYLGKKVNLRGMAMKIQKDNPSTMIIGRFAMTCCIEDLAVFGFICDFETKPNLDLDDWISLSAVVDKDYAEKYDLWYPVLRIKAFEKCDAPDNQVLENV